MTDKQSRALRLAALLPTLGLHSDMSLYGVDPYYPLIVPDDIDGGAYHTPEMMMTLNRIMLGDHHRNQGPIVIGSGWPGNDPALRDDNLMFGMGSLVQNVDDEKKVTGSPLLLKLVSRI